LSVCEIREFLKMELTPKLSIAVGFRRCPLLLNSEKFGIENNTAKYAQRLASEGMTELFVFRLHYKTLTVLNIQYVA